MNIVHIKKYPLDGVKWAIKTACIVEAQPSALWFEYGKENFKIQVYFLPIGKFL
jgi:hypothetical protein